MAIFLETPSIFPAMALSLQKPRICLYGALRVAWKCLVRRLAPRRGSGQKSWFYFAFIYRRQGICQVQTQT